MRGPAGLKCATPLYVLYEAARIAHFLLWPPFEWAISGPTLKESYE